MSTAPSDVRNSGEEWRTPCGVPTLSNSQKRISTSLPDMSVCTAATDIVYSSQPVLQRTDARPSFDKEIGKLIENRAYTGVNGSGYQETSVMNTPTNLTRDNSREGFVIDELCVMKNCDPFFDQITSHVIQIEVVWIDPDGPIQEQGTMNSSPSSNDYLAGKQEQGELQQNPNQSSTADERLPRDEDANQVVEDAVPHRREVVDLNSW